MSDVQGFQKLPDGASSSFKKCWVKLGVIVVEYKNGSRYKITEGVTQEIKDQMLADNNISIGRIIQAMKPVKCVGGEYDNLD